VIGYSARELWEYIIKGIGKIKDTIITFAFILLIGIAIMLVLDYIGKNPSKEDCIIGKDSPDCLERNKSGHPLYQN